MTAAELDQVRATPLFAGLTDDQLDCLRGGEVIEVPAGHVLANEDEKTGKFYVVLDGEVRIWRLYDRQSVLMAVSKPGSHLGELMLLLDVPWLSMVRVSKPARLFRLSEENFWRMLAECRTIAQEIFRAASSRMRNLEGFSHQREKLASLGTMAAGLAHELNNPAAAAKRAATHLRDAANRAQILQCSLSHILSLENWELLTSAAQKASTLARPKLDDLARSDRAEEIGKWLETHGVATAWELAPTFVNAGLDLDCLAELMEELPEASRADALGWLEARINLEALVNQIEQSVGRVSELIAAVKSYSYMDQSPRQEIDIHDGIESTLTMLGHKLKNVNLVRAFDRSIPRVMAYGGELNQVWTNLIDNAIYAVGGAGKICVGTSLEDGQIVVEIMDNGSGISPEVQSRIFEPFFTTKHIGTGTGLGLVISNRIVADRHGGEIEFESRPGETRFKVRLPLSPN